MTSARALWTAQRGRLPCWPADAMSCCPVIAGRAVTFCDPVPTRNLQEHAICCKAARTYVTRVSECQVSCCRVCGAWRLCCRVVIRDVRCRNSRPFYCPRLFVRMGRERESKRSDASRDRGSPRPGRTRVPYFWFAYRRDFRSTEVDNYRLPESGPAKTVSRGRGRRSAGPAGGAVRGRGSEPLCRPPSVEPRYNMNYLSNRNPNQPSELHCTPTRPRAVSECRELENEIGDTAIRTIRFRASTFIIDTSHPPDLTVARALKSPHRRTPSPRELGVNVGLKQANPESPGPCRHMPDGGAAYEA
jgi:hypothetical protein